MALAEELAKDHGVVSIDLTASGRTMLVTLIGHDLDAISNWTMTLGLDPRVVALQTHHVSELVTDASLWRPKALSQTEELAVRAWPPRNTATTNLALPELVTLLELLSQDIRAPIAALAEGSGLSRRRVSESLNAMTASGELVVRIDVARRLTPFPVFAYYFLKGQPSTLGQVATQLSRIPEIRMAARTVGRASLITSFWLRSLTDLQHLGGLGQQVPRSGPGRPNPGHTDGQAYRPPAGRRRSGHRRPTARPTGLSGSAACLRTPSDG